MVTYLGGSILITIFALGGSIVSYNLHNDLSFNEYSLSGNSDGLITDNPSGFCIFEAIFAK